MISLIILLAPIGIVPSPIDEVLDFEGVPSGPFTELALQGNWTCVEGKAEIDPQHAHTGSQCLRLLGGEMSRVQWMFESPRDVHAIQFWSERWTRASPFDFRIGIHVNGKWVECLDASSMVRIGGFHTHVQAIVDAKISGVRFSCVSPPERGVLIDDLKLLSPGPMTVQSCAAPKNTLPILVNREHNPILRFEIDVRGNLAPLSVESVTVHCGESTTKSLREIGASFAGSLPDQNVGTEARFATTSAITPSIVLRGKQELKPGTNHFWVTATPRSDANLDDRLQVRVGDIKLSNGRVLRPDSDFPSGKPRFGVAVRDAGDDGAKVYRIPGLTTTKDGTLIAVYDVRWNGWRDLPGHIDVGMSRSVDGGRTWEPMRVIMDMGQDPKWQGDGVGDPSILTDRKTGRIFAAAVWSHGNRGWHGSGPGLSPEETGQLMMVHSDDDGLTWSQPENLTVQVKDPAWAFLLQGPGRGISMEDGTLVFPAQYQASPDQNRLPHATILWSKDHGKSWSLGRSAKGNTTEAAVVELEDGILMLNIRDNRGGSRAIHTSEDLGETWSEHPTSRGALPEPVCMASLLHVGREIDGQNDGRLLFSNPNVSAAPRRHLTIQASSDYGNTWPEKARVLLDEGPSAGYSCLTMIDEHTVGILYESSRAHLVFQRIPLEDLFGRGSQ